MLAFGCGLARLRPRALIFFLLFVVDRLAATLAAWLTLPAGCGLARVRPRTLAVVFSSSSSSTMLAAACTVSWLLAADCGLARLRPRALALALLVLSVGA